jgi:3-oxoacyl-[acyl-carrier protein] reductase
MTLSGKTALVTGGGRGIGQQVCLRLARMGAVVGINFVRNAAAAEETLALIEKEGGTGFLAPFDVADPAAVESGIKDVAAAHEAVDILVNNAGITRDGLMARMKTSDWDQVLDTNLKGAFPAARRP